MSPRLGDTWMDFARMVSFCLKDALRFHLPPPHPALWSKGPLGRALPSTASWQRTNFTGAVKKDLTLIKTVTSWLPFGKAGPRRLQTSGAVAGAAGGSVGCRRQHPGGTGAPTHTQPSQKAPLGWSPRARQRAGPHAAGGSAEAGAWLAAAWLCRHGEEMAQTANNSERCFLGQACLGSFIMTGM